MTRIRLAEKPYVSINGEGVYIGNTVIFIRTQGCAVGCSWCDSKFTWKKNAGVMYDWDKLDQLIYVLGDKLPLWWTGGEPLESWESIKGFLESYGRDRNLMVSAVPVFVPDLFQYIDHLIVDVKLKSAKIKYDQLRVVDQYMRDIIGSEVSSMELKMVVGENDVEEAISIVDRYEDIDVTIQPLYHDETEVNKMAGKMSSGFERVFSNPKDMKLDAWYDMMMKRLGDDRNNVRLLPQLHKMIWPNKTRGV